MNAEKHYVICSNLQRFESWAYDNLPEWHPRGHGIIVTRTSTYRAITSLHQLRGVTLTPETLHYTDGWHDGLTGRGALEMEQYITVCLAMGAAK